MLCRENAVRFGVCVCVYVCISTSLEHTLCVQIVCERFRTFISSGRGNASIVCVVNFSGSVPVRSNPIIYTLLSGIPRTVFSVFMFFVFFNVFLVIVLPIRMAFRIAIARELCVVFFFKFSRMCS